MDVLDVVLNWYCSFGHRRASGSLEDRHNMDEIHAQSGEIN